MKSQRRNVEKENKREESANGRRCFRPGPPLRRCRRSIPSGPSGRPRRRRGRRRRTRPRRPAQNKQTNKQSKQKNIGQHIIIVCIRAPLGGIQGKKGEE